MTWADILVLSFWLIRRWCEIAVTPVNSQFYPGECFLASWLQSFPMQPPGVPYLLRQPKPRPKMRHTDIAQLVLSNVCSNRINTVSTKKPESGGLKHHDGTVQFEVAGIEATEEEWECFVVVLNSCPAISW